MPRVCRVWGDVVVGCAHATQSLIELKDLEGCIDRGCHYVNGFNQVSGGWVCAESELVPEVQYSLRRLKLFK